MTVSLNALGIAGTILFWLGVLVCVGSICLFIAVSNGISDGPFSEKGVLNETTSILTFPPSDTILIGRGERLVFLLPFAAGIALVIAGTYVRMRVPEFKEALGRITNHSDNPGDNYPETEGRSQ